MQGDVGGAEAADIFEGADAARRLGDAQPLLGMFLLGDVGQHPGEAQDPVVLAAFGAALGGHPAYAAIRRRDAELTRELVDAVHHAGHGDADTHAVVGMDMVEEDVRRGAQRELAPVGAIQLGKSAVGVELAARHVPKPDADRARQQLAGIGLRDWKGRRVAAHGVLS